MNKVLIANRGEIAVRIHRACADYGVRSVAVYADADMDAPHVHHADEAWGLPGNAPADTYLHVGRLLDIARKSGADAVHPGYGFLSESARFAQAVIDAGLIWIGPSPDAIVQLGDKVQARKIARKVGAPLVAGTPEPVRDVEDVRVFAVQHGLPIIIGYAILQFGYALLQIATLGFLGFGVAPPTPEWGVLIAEGRNYVATAWWLTVMPGVMVIAIVLASNRIGRFISQARG